MFPDVSKDLVSLVKRMLEFNPFFRISAGDALKSKLFDGIRVPQFEQPCPSKVVIEGFLDESFDYNNFTSSKYQSDHDLAKMVARESKIVQKISPLYNL